MTDTQTTTPGARSTTTQDGVWANCRGLRHNDRGEIVTHDRCGASVAKRDDGRLFNLRHYGNWAARGFECYLHAHTCDPEAVEVTTARRELAMAQGKIDKGVPVVVYKGRKVPVGTRGVVTWTGEDSFGKARIGLRDADGTTHWTAESNCRVDA